MHRLFKIVTCVYSCQVEQYINKTAKLIHMRAGQIRHQQAQHTLLWQYDIYIYRIGTYLAASSEIFSASHTCIDYL